MQRSSTNIFIVSSLTWVGCESQVVKGPVMVTEGDPSFARVAPKLRNELLYFIESIKLTCVIQKSFDDFFEFKTVFCKYQFM